MQTSLEQLRQQGFRLTPQRILILEALDASHEHVSAEQIHAAVIERYPYINIATVYRNLQWLHEQQLVRRIDLGDGRLQWETATHPIHHHLVCERCKAVQVIDNHVVACLSNHVAEHYGFAVNFDHLAIFGLCADCQATEVGS